MILERKLSFLKNFTQNAIFLHFSCVKKFLRALKEPVIPHSLWRTFVDAANNPDTTDAETALYQVRLLGSLSP